MYVRPGSLFKLPLRSHLNVRKTNNTQGTPKIQFASAREWVAVARTCPEYSFQQSPAYSLELAKLRRASCEFVYVRHTQDDDRIIGAASVRVRAVTFPGAGLAYIGAGPLLIQGFGDPDGPLALESFISAATAEYVNRRQLSLRIALPAVDTHVSSYVADVFLSQGFGLARSSRGYRTFLINLARSSEEIRASLSHKWRNQLNSALRRPISIELTSKAGAIARFAPLLDETSRRKGFTSELGASFFDRVQRLADDEERMLVAIAVADGHDVAGVVVSLLGETAVYVLGATTADGMKSKAAYALHWQVMQTAREIGCRWYDLGGINPETNPGVYHFKSGFGGSDVVTPGPFEVRPSGVAGLVSRVVDESYARLKQWRFS